MVSDDDLLNCPKTYLVQQNFSQNTDFTPIGPGRNHGPFLGGSGARLLSGVRYYLANVLQGTIFGFDCYRYWPLFQLCYGDPYRANLEEYCLQFTENIEAIATPTSMMHVAKRFGMGAPCRIISASFPHFLLSL